MHSAAVLLNTFLLLLFGLALTATAWDINVQVPPSISQRMLRDRPSQPRQSPGWDLFAAQEESLECEDCMNGHPMPDCPCPVACDPERFDPFPCKGCMDGHGMPGCPKPEWCGYEGEDGQKHPGCPCVDCQPGQSTAGCPNPEHCGYTEQCDNCQEDRPTETCPCPAACHPGHHKPFQCHNCMDGHAMPTCPFPGRCGYEPIDEDDIPGCQCKGCMDGMAMPGCPDPYICGFEPECIGCMPGMAMPGCPYPDACPMECPMAMYFGTDYNVCLWFKDWHITNEQQYVGGIFFLIFFCFVREAASAWRRHRQQGFLRKRLIKSRWDYVVDALYYALSLTLSYLLMLVFMTYNVGFCITIVAACGVAHFLFAWYLSRK